MNVAYYAWRTIELISGAAHAHFAPNEYANATRTCVAIICLVLLFYAVRTYFMVYVVNACRVYVSRRVKAERVAGGALRLTDLKHPL